MNCPIHGYSCGGSCFSQQKIHFNQALYDAMLAQQRGASQQPKAPIKENDKRKLLLLLR